MMLEFWKWMYRALEQASLWVYYHKIEQKEMITLVSLGVPWEMKFYSVNSQSGQMTESTIGDISKYDS